MRRLLFHGPLAVRNRVAAVLGGSNVSLKHAAILLLSSLLFAGAVSGRDAGSAEAIDGLSAAVSAESPPRRIRFRHLTNRDGLSYSRVDSILQDRRGFLWLGTLEGLNRFDGTSFRVYRADAADPDSLAPGVIRDLAEDRLGRLWIAVDSGLDRFDPADEKFTHFRHDPTGSNSLNQNAVRRLLVDREGDLWIGTKKGLDRLDLETEIFTHYLHEPENPNSPSHGQINGIAEGVDGAIWIATLGGLDRLDPDSGTFTHFRHDPESASRFGADGLGSDTVWSVHEDHAGTIWVGTAVGLDRFDPRTGSWRSYRSHPDDPRSLSPGAVHVIHEDLAGGLWFGTWGGGLSLYDRRNDAFVRFRHDSGDPTSLSHDVVLAVAEDDQGGMWFGTFGGGANHYHPLAQGFQTYRHRPGDPQSLSPGAVWSIVEDRDRVLWFGMLGAGLTRFDPDEGKARHLRHDPKNPKGLPSDLILTLEEGISGDLWIGMDRGGLSRFDPRRETFTNYLHDPENPDSLSDPSVFSILATEEDGREIVWVGTDYGGLNRLDPVDRRFTHYRHDPDDPESLSRDGVLLFVDQDREGMLWIGALGGGLNRFDPRREVFRRFLHDPADPRSLSNNQVVSFFEDGSGTLWIGALNGALNRYDSESGDFTRFDEHQTITAMLEDTDGRLWMSSVNGIRSFDPVQNKTVYYDVGDGLSDNEIKGRSQFMGRDGTMYFGSLRGVTAFKPSRFATNLYRPPVVLTKFELFGREVSLDRSITHLDSVALDHHENFFAFEYSALSFHRADKNRYAYKLEGFDADWVEVGSRRRAGYTNVPPGDYVFRVRGSNNDGVWNEDGAAVHVVVRPPFWKTWWAYLLYALALGVAVGAYVRTHRKELERERDAVEQERRVSARLREVDRLKDEFLANTSHELRTPLYGIVGLAESLRDDAEQVTPEALGDGLNVIIRSGHRLGNLVDDILDFSKLEHDGLELEFRRVDLKALVDVVLTALRPLARETQKKNLMLINSVPADLPPVRADENRLQQILYNLVGNAIKFTEDGRVEVRASPEDEEIVVEVVDTGIGIAPEVKNRLFHPFEQGDASVQRSYGGTGLGLAISKQLIELHGGRIDIESVPGEGARFFFTLPRSSQELPAGAEGEKLRKIYALDEAVAGEKEIGPHAETGSVILVVDDEPVVREVLRRQLSARGDAVLSASGGAEALKILETESVDLILLDIMMPNMSGYEVCRRIRSTRSREELPILFLSAKNQVEDLLTGFAEGANDYLTKPISKSELLVRVETHLDLLRVHRGQVEEVEILRGLLPICCNCKKIRDDEGIWSEIEIYLAQRADVEFTHGYCSECVEIVMRDLERRRADEEKDVDGG